MNLNKVLIVGRVTANIELKTTPGGASVTSFSIATNRVWTGKSGNREEETEFHNIVAWGKQAEIASQYLTKGSLVLIEGRLRTRSWQDKQGQTRKTTEIVSERLQLGPKPAGAPRDESPKIQDAIKEEIPTVDIEDDIKPEDLPF